MTEPVQDLAAVISCVLCAVGLRALLGRRLPLWGLVLLLVAPIALLLGRPAWFYFSYHGSLHTAIAYTIFEGGLPPEHPLLAGTRLGYPHGHHAVVATLMRWLPLPPPALFALTNLLCLPAAALAIDRIARKLSSDALVHRYAVVLALVNLAPFSIGPLADLAGAWELPVEPRLIPLHKFATVNSNQIGMTLFLWTLFGLLCLFGGARRRPAVLAGIAGGLLAVGLLYPLAWIFTAAAVGVGAVITWLRGDGEERRAALAAGAVLVATSALLVPVFLYLAAGRPTALPSGVSRLELTRHLQILLFYLPLPAALLWFRRVGLRSALRGHAQPVRVLLVCLALAALAFTLLSLPLRTEYKFLLMGSLVLGILAAVPLGELHRDRPLAAVAVLALALLPWCRFIVEVGSGWPVTHRVTADRHLLRHVDPAHDELYRWIDQSTPRDAVVVDTEPTAPVLARRPLFAACGERRPAGAPRNGWGPSSRVASIQMLGGDADLYERRCALGRRLLAPQGPAVSAAIWEGLGDEIPARPLVVVARDPRLIERLDAAPQLSAAFRNSAATVFLWQR